MTRIAYAHPKIDRETISFLRAYPLPAQMRHLRRVIVQLPLPVVLSLAGVALAHDLTDDVFADGLHSALKFQNQSAWRCCACFRWLDEPNVSLVCVAAGSVTFNALCPACEHQFPSDQSIRDRAAGYVAAPGWR